MEKPTFTIAMAAGACRPGAIQAAGLFERGQHYTMKEIIEAGLHPKNILWLLLRRAREDVETLDLMKAWAFRCAEASGRMAGKLKTADECYADVRESMRFRKRKLGITRGLMSWAFEMLGDVAGAEGIDYGIGEMATDDR